MRRGEPRDYRAAMRERVREAFRKNHDRPAMKGC